MRLSWLPIVLIPLLGLPAFPASPAVSSPAAPAMRIEEIEYNVGLNDDDFSRRQLEAGAK